jgi:hypothetical protein
MHHLACSASATREARQLSLFKEVGSNVRTWGAYVVQADIKDPVDKGNYPRAVAGAAVAVASTVFEFSDYLLAGIVDKKLSAPGSGIMPRMRRDTAELLGDAVRLRPLKTVANILRLPGSLVMDTAETVAGIEHRPQGIANAVRSQFAAVLRN